MVLLRMRFVDPGDHSPDGRLLPCLFTLITGCPGRYIFCYTFCNYTLRNNHPGLSPGIPVRCGVRTFLTSCEQDSAIVYNGIEYFKEHLLTYTNYLNCFILFQFIKSFVSKIICSFIFLSWNMSYSIFFL